MVFFPGLVSVTFRNLNSDEIIELCKENGLTTIEWGSDVHVPFQDESVAVSVSEKTLNNNLKVAEYGSYYRIGASPQEDILKVAKSAKLLKTNLVRVWGFVKNLQNSTPEEYENAVSDGKRICDLFPDITFCLECHQNTLTENYQDALKFMSDVGRENIRMFWQPNQFKSHEENIEALKNLLPYVKSVHVFSWDNDGKNTVTHPLSYFENRWIEYIKILKTSNEKEINMMLEFMHDGKKESLPETAEVLLSWIGD